MRHRHCGKELSSHVAYTIYHIRKVLARLCNHHCGNEGTIHGRLRIQSQKHLKLNICGGIEWALAIAKQLSNLFETDPSFGANTHSTHILSVIYIALRHVKPHFDYSKGLHVGMESKPTTNSSDTRHRKNIIRLWPPFVSLRYPQVITRPIDPILSVPWAFTRYGWETLYYLRCKERRDKVPSIGAIIREA